MMLVKMTDTYKKWCEKLKDSVAKSRIVMRIRRLETGNIGDAKSVGDGVHELRIDYGRGYRVYFANENGESIILLVGGDKSSQQRDIKQAKTLLREMHENGADNG